MSTRSLPNIIITGTPGCGKTSHAALLAQQLSQLKHISISEYAKENNCIDGHDQVRDSDIVDEDKLLDALEPELEKGGVIVDWHVCEVFPERLIDLVIVLRCDNSILFSRLSKRGYKENKIQENLDVEIMDILIQEARDSYKSEVVIELRSDDVDQIEENVARISQWVEMWQKDHPEGVSNEFQPGSDDEDSDDE
ncbi:nucleoside-triphosphatase [Saccharomycopsis crataegensis]|uniref:Adenylate kinase isoenzyme 6 homolog n=1 Tax=Saccharomycopsis crataegensis TaxID=43959 RepID=A0AAV5QSP7_9ASCO|nr:nucleoside-triphosphatase [Saccharomycopsis crataegensis]